MRYVATLFTLVFLLLAFPHAAFAHATPVESSPASGANVQDAKEVRIRFSERLEGNSSRITVKSASGDTVHSGKVVVGSDPYILSVPIEVSKNGEYVVSWSVVSKDDGHFTKGSYAFSVGSELTPISSSNSNATVIQVTTLSEAFAMFVEFFGNSMLWGVFLMFALVFRNLLKRGSVADPKLIEKLYTFFVFIGAAAVAIGGLSQILLKTIELSQLHDTVLRDGLSMYLGTVAGSSVLYRMGAVLILAVLFLMLRRKIFASSRFSLYEGMLLVCLLTFAYFRAIVSHASANPFFPQLSIAVNVVHLIEKDLWLGVLLVILAILCTRAREMVSAVIPQTFILLAVNLILISFSASYIIWLHLKDFGNIPTTTWGETLLLLLVASGLLVGLRAYHVLAYTFRPAMFSRFLPSTIGAETAASALVVFFSSLIIITSPPLHTAHARVFYKADQGVSVRLEQSLYEDSRMLLTVFGVREEPLLLIGETNGGLQVKLEKRFEGGYVFPVDLLKGKETKVHVIAKRTGRYDAHFTFNVMPGDFVQTENQSRSLDFFTFAMISIALASALFGAILLRVMRNAPRMTPPVSRVPLWGIICGVLMALVIGLQSAQAMQGTFGNHFRRQCIADGNTWHVMQPARGGKHTSKTPTEGCMMMSGLYHIVDGREYAYLRSLPPARVTLATLPQRIYAGVPTKILLTFMEEDGSPAKMSVIHDRLVHLIIISADMTEFAHVHPEDIVAEIDSVAESRFEITHTFPKGGEYLLAVDYLHGLTPETRRFRVTVDGVPVQDSEPRLYVSPHKVENLEVSLRYSQLPAGEISTLTYTVMENGSPVADLEPYLSAAMHLAVVKGDLSEFVHTHGEVHPPGYIPPKTLAMVHNHIPPPSRFGPNIEAHVIFPSAGLYTIFGEFARHGKIFTTRFTVRVE